MMRNFMVQRRECFQGREKLKLSVKKKENEISFPQYSALAFLNKIYVFLYKYHRFPNNIQTLKIIFEIFYENHDTVALYLKQQH